MTIDNAMAPEAPPAPGAAPAAAAAAPPAHADETKPKRAPRKKAEPKVDAPPPEPMKKTVRVMAAKVRKYHPYQKVDITTVFPVELPMDNWLEVQIAAKVLKVVD